MDDWKKNEEELMKRFNNFEDNNSKFDSDFKCLERKNDRKLVLTVRHNFSKDYTSPWILPQFKNNGESLREVFFLIIVLNMFQSAEKCLGELADNDISVRIFGNAPFDCYKYKYPNKLANKLGTKGNFVGFYFQQCFFR